MTTPEERAQIRDESLRQHKLPPETIGGSRVAQRARRRAQGKKQRERLIREQEARNEQRKQQGQRKGH